MSGYGQPISNPLPSVQPSYDADTETLLFASVQELQDTISSQVTAAGVDFSGGEPAYPSRPVSLGPDDARSLSGSPTAPGQTTPWWAASGAAIVAWSVPMIDGYRLVSVDIFTRQASGTINQVNLQRVTGSSGSRSQLGSSLVGTLGSSDETISSAALNAAFSFSQYLRIEVSLNAGGRLYGARVVVDKP